jgi:hypothetical protein
MRRLRPGPWVYERPEPPAPAPEAVTAAPAEAAPEDRPVEGGAPNSLAAALAPLLALERQGLLRHR